MNLQQVAKALGGKVVGGRVRAPGPGHSPNDDSLIVKIDAAAPGGFLVKSFANDDWKDCREYVKQRLGIANGPYRKNWEKRKSLNTSTKALAQVERDGVGALAIELWRHARSIVNSPVASYFMSRGLLGATELSLGHVIRFHPACPFGLEYGTTARLPAMLALFRDILTDEPCGIHRTALKPDGRAKADVSGLGSPKKMLGKAKGAAIKISPDEFVMTGIHVTEGVETALAAMTLGFVPIWALGSAGAIASFEPLPGIESLTVMADNDATGIEAAMACGRAWRAAGREVRILRPKTENADVNDLLRGASA